MLIIFVMLMSSTHADLCHVDVCTNHHVGYATNPLLDHHVLQ